MLSGPYRRKLVYKFHDLIVYNLIKIYFNKKEKLPILINNLMFCSESKIQKKKIM